MNKGQTILAQAGSLLCVLALALLLGTAHPASAAQLTQAGTGTVTGQVVSADNVPLANVHLAAYNESQTSTNRVALGEVVTDNQGRYTIEVPAGPVWMSFLTQDINGQSYWGYDNTPVNAVAGATTANVNFVVAVRVLPAGPTATSVPTVAPAPTEVPAATPVPAVTPAPGMPTTGAGPSGLTGLLLGLGVLMLLAAFGLRRWSARLG